MAVDILTEAHIAKPRAEVAAYAMDPDNAPTWYANIQSVEWETEPPLRVGSRLAFVARFLGRRMAYTYEVLELVDGERMVMSTAQGPFPMTTTYSFEDAAEGTKMTLRNHGDPTGFQKVMGGMMAAAMRKANTADVPPATVWLPHRQRRPGLVEARPLPRSPRRQP